MLLKRNNLCFNVLTRKMLLFLISGAKVLLFFDTANK